MKEILINGKTLPEVYHQAILSLEEEGEIITCNDWSGMQKELAMTFVVTDPLSEPRISRLYPGGFRELQQYTMEMTDGILDFKIGDRDGLCWEYTYHDRIFNYRGLNQFEWCEQELRRSSDTRRAVIDVRDSIVDTSNTDPACLQNIQYFIRNGHLDAMVLMRSNDAVQASFMNAFAFIVLQSEMAKRLGVPVGTYTHRANSFHCYERNFMRLKQYAEAIKGKKNEELTYNYEEFYKELMEESVPEINKTIETLKMEMKNR